MKCSCSDWLIGIEKINAPIMLQSVRSGWQYDGKPFVYCPWCGKTLTKEANVKLEGGKK